MARTFNGTNDSIEAASAPVTAVPLTIAAWANPTSSVGRSIVSIGVSAGTSRFMLFMNTTGIQAAAIESGTNAASNGTTPLPINQWSHCAAVFESNTSRTAYFNGTAATPNTTSCIPLGLNRLNIGARYGAGVIGAYFPGAIAEVGVWNVALTADEIASLSKGFPCRLVRPSALVFYSRLIRNVMDIRNGVTLSELGTGTTVSDHPRIIYPC